MKKYIPLLVLAVFMARCNFETPTQFSNEANATVLNSLSGDKATFKAVIAQYKGKKVYTGPRGGRYYINKNGNKTYISDDK